MVVLVLAGEKNGALKATAGSVSASLTGGTTTPCQHRAAFAEHNAENVVDRLTRFVA